MTVSALALPIDPGATPCACPDATREPVWMASLSLIQAGVECDLCHRRWRLRATQEATQGNLGQPT